MKCNFCGEDNNNNEVYCNSCGMKLTIKKPVDEDEYEKRFIENIVVQTRKATSAHIFGFISIGLALGAAVIPFMGQIGTFVIGLIALIKGLCGYHSCNKKLCLLGIILGSCAMLCAVAMFLHWEYIIDMKNEPYYQSYEDFENMAKILILNK